MEDGGVSRDLGTPGCPLQALPCPERVVLDATELEPTENLVRVEGDKLRGTAYINSLDQASTVTPLPIEPAASLQKS